MFMELSDSATGAWSIEAAASAARPPVNSATTSRRGRRSHRARLLRWCSWMNRFVSPVSLDVVDAVSGDGRVELACAAACAAAVASAACAVPGAVSAAAAAATAVPAFFFFYQNPHSHSY